MNTPFLDEVYGQVIFDRELVFKFFTIFSLFEYALKLAGFCTKGRSGEAQPDWQAYAEAIHPNFNSQSNPELAEAVDYIKKLPVKKQIVKDGGLVYELRKRPPGISETVWLSILVRGVRNNLFHGGKFRFDEKRDPDLIKSTLVVLEAWAQLHPDVKYVLNYARLFQSLNC
jgi:hypothetical protein